MTSEIMLGPLLTLINHQNSQGLPMLFVQHTLYKDSKGLPSTKVCTYFYEVTFTCTHAYFFLKPIPLFLFSHILSLGNA